MKIRALFVTLSGLSAAAVAVLVLAAVPAPAGAIAQPVGPAMPEECVCSRGLRLAWPCAHFEDLTPEQFAQLAPLEAELVIFGSGTRTRFAKPQWLQPLIARRIGVESMDTHAACRTFNILAGEGRHVIAALVLEGAPD